MLTTQKRPFRRVFFLVDPLIEDDVFLLEAVNVSTPQGFRKAAP